MIMVAYFLQTAGIKCCINAVIAGSKYRNRVKDNKCYVKSYPVKKYSQNLDFNEITFEVADPRVFRGRDFHYIASTFWKEFKSKSDSKKGFNIGSGLGSDLSQREAEIQFEEYKNYLIDESKKGDLRLFNKNKKLMLLSGFELSKGITEDQMQELAIEEFFNLVCKIDIQFNGFFKQQVNERKKTKFETLARLRSKILDTAFDFSFSNSPYSDTQSDIMKEIATRDKYKEIATKISNEFN